MSQIESLGTAADTAKGKLSVLDMSVTPHVQQGGLAAMESPIDRIIENARSLGSMISAANSQAASIPSPNVGGGTRTGRVAQAFASSPSAGEA